MSAQKLQPLPELPPEATITSVESYISYLRKIEYLPKQDDVARSNPLPADIRIYYRGQSAPFPLLPKLAREEVIDPLTKTHHTKDLFNIQKELIFRLARYAEQYRPAASIPKDYDFLHWMCLAQHHGLPTFLLDFTINPMIALFFACYFRNEAEEKQTGVIWGMNLKLGHERDPGTVLHLEKVPFEMNDPQDGAYSYLRRTGHPIGTCPTLIVPRMLTKRIESQAGRFVLHADEKVALDDLSGADLPWRDLRILATVPSGSKGSILNDLRHFRIHWGSVMADLDAYAQFLGRGNL